MSACYTEVRGVEWRGLALLLLLGWPRLLHAYTGDVSPDHRSFGTKPTRGFRGPKTHPLQFGAPTAGSSLSLTLPEDGLASLCTCSDPKNGCRRTSLMILDNIAHIWNRKNGKYDAAQQGGTVTDLKWGAHGTLHFKFWSSDSADTQITEKVINEQGTRSDLCRRISG
jgi:hypothetical protein